MSGRKEDDLEGLLKWRAKDMSGEGRRQGVEVENRDVRMKKTKQEQSTQAEMTNRRGSLTVVGLPAISTNCNRNLPHEITRNQSYFPFLS